MSKGSIYITGHRQHDGHYACMVEGDLIWLAFEAGQSPAPSGWLPDQLDSFRISYREGPALYYQTPTRPHAPRFGWLGRLIEKVLF